MKSRKLGIIGGSGLYKMEGFEKTKWKKIITPWGKPSDEILIAKFDKEEIDSLLLSEIIFTINHFTKRLQYNFYILPYHLKISSRNLVLVSMKSHPLDYNLG